MKTRSAVVTIAVAMVMAATLYAADVNLKGVKCLMNPKANAKATKSVAYKGGKVYFCCDGCPKKFDADKHAVKANQQLVATEQYKQEKCPLTGRPINKNQTVKVGTTKVMLCCGGCKGKVAKAKGDAQAEMVFANKPFEKGFKLAKSDKKKD